MERCLPVVTALMFVLAIVGCIADPARGTVFALLFIGCALDPSNWKD